METIALKARKWVNGKVQVIIVTVPTIKIWGKIALHWSIENPKAELDSERFTLTHVPSLKAVANFCAGVPAEIYEPIAQQFDQFIPDDHTLISGVQKKKCYELIGELETAERYAPTVVYYCPHCSHEITRKYNLQLTENTTCNHCGNESGNWSLTTEPFSYLALEKLLKDEQSAPYFDDAIVAMQVLDFVFLKLFGRK